ncbi:24501_t:CDS:2, partial [Racocetra persica]
SSTSEEEIDYSFENSTQKTDFGNKMGNFFPSPIPVTASVFERGVIFAISLYASMRLVKIMAANEVGRIESLVPTVAAAKLVDIHRSKSVHDDINIEFFEANFELCIVMGCGILIHMFMSKHVNLPNMSVIWAMSIVTLLSIILVISMASLGLLPLFETIVAQAITLLAVELWVITVKKVRLVIYHGYAYRDYARYVIHYFVFLNTQYRMFLIGIILSPLLIYSRNLAQRPAWKNKRKRVFLNGRKWTSFALFVGTSLIPEFMHLAFSVALSAFIFLEYLRYFAVYPLGKNIHIFLSEFLDNRDSGPCILSHLYLLVGCAACIWMQGTSILANMSGILTLGLGDAMASIIGKRYGRRRWPGTSKTVEGTIA